MRWTEQRAREWDAARGWQCGFNYLPASAVNSTEMWQAETFDLPRIETELGWARDIGFNSVRVFLQYLVWEHDGDGLLHRLDLFLNAAHERGLSVLPILLDDCAFSGRLPYLGPQDAPTPGVHNSGWTASPGLNKITDRACWPALRAYANSVVGRFAQDTRILAWDIYNEPGNGIPKEIYYETTLPLVRETFDWVRGANPVQPLTVGAWNTHLPEVENLALELSDVVSFHEYNSVQDMEAFLARLRKANRPLLCTEWMRRGFGSEFATHLPHWKREHIGCFFWGLVNGKTQTHIPWDTPPGAPEPPVWFHDLLRSDGTPYDAAEIALIKQTLREK